VEPAYQRHVKSQLTPALTEELHTVDALAQRLLEAMVEAADELRELHVFNAKSAAVQTLLSRVLHDELHFQEEVVLRPQDGLVTRARPDFFFPLSDERGILAEVERGGTTTTTSRTSGRLTCHRTRITCS
jgi:hypothetical protein